MLVLLGVSGQLERYRWLARVAGADRRCASSCLLDDAWIVPGVQRLASGMFYISAGPLTGVHISQLVVWLGIGARDRAAIEPARRAQARCCG